MTCPVCEPGQEEKWVTPIEDLCADHQAQVLRNASTHRYKRENALPSDEMNARAYQYVREEAV